MNVCASKEELHASHNFFFFPHLLFYFYLTLFFFLSFVLILYLILPCIYYESPSSFILCRFSIYVYLLFILSLQPPQQTQPMRPFVFPCVCLIRRGAQSSLLALIYLACRPIPSGLRPSIYIELCPRITLT